MPAARLSEEQKAQARALYLADEHRTVDEVAARFGVGRTVMLRALAGVTRPRGGRPIAVSTRRLAELRSQGYTAEQIARRYNMSRRTVYVRLASDTNTSRETEN